MRRESFDTGKVLRSRQRLKVSAQPIEETPGLPFAEQRARDVFLFPRSGGDFSLHEQRKVRAGKL